MMVFVYTQPHGVDPYNMVCETFLAEDAETFPNFIYFYAELAPAELDD